MKRYYRQLRETIKSDPESLHQIREEERLEHLETKGDRTSKIYIYHGFQRKQAKRFEKKAKFAETRDLRI